jgi:hypothetical protein
MNKACKTCLRLLPVWICFCFAGLVQGEAAAPGSAKGSGLSENPLFDVKVHRQKAVLICDSIAIYDRRQKRMKVVHGVRGKLLNTDSISVQMFSINGSEDRCDLHYFVKVRSEMVNGWVYGKTVFEQAQDGRDSSFSSGGIDFWLTPLKNFNIGVYDEKDEMLSFCDNPAPLLVFNSLYMRSEYIRLQQAHDEYPEAYLTFDMHDGWVDTLISAVYDGKALRLKILRTYQEGFADIEVLIHLNEKQSYATIARVVKREE